MRISIAMCTYNGARFLAEQLSSIKAQTRQPDELVVCDDCSTDKTVAIVEKFAANAPFPVEFQINNSRLGSTRNFERAISLCQGDVIALSDQDDIWNVDKLDQQEQLLNEEKDVGLVFSDAEIVDENSRPVGDTLWQAIDFKMSLQKKLKTSGAFPILIERPLVTGATMAFRTEFRDLILPIPDNLPVIHDAWIALMISLTAKLEIIQQPLIKYRQHESQQLGARVEASPTKPAKQLKSDFADEIRKLEAMCQRVEANSNRFEFRFQSDLEQRLGHFRTRSDISQRKLAGITGALGELFSGRYHRYSGGWFSLARDLLR